MNLIEIGKKTEIQPTETAEQTKNSETITESLTQPLQTPEESPIKLKAERDILVQSFEKAKEFMRTQKKQIQTLEEEKQTILSDRQRLREEVRKSTVEIQRLTTELSETQKLNQSLQQSNDDLRNRNGLMSRSEQEQIEKEIEDDVIDFFRIPFMWYIRFCEWLVFPTYDNAFKQKIAYTGGRTWIIRILAIIVVFFILAIVTLIITEGIRQYEKMWDEISQMFLVGSLSGISVLGDAIREYLPVNLILLFGFVNTGIMLLKMYFRKKFDYM